MLVCFEWFCVSNRHRSKVNKVPKFVFGLIDLIYKHGHKRLANRQSVMALARSTAGALTHVSKHSGRGTVLTAGTHGASSTSSSHLSDESSLMTNNPWITGPTLRLRDLGGSSAARRPPLRLKDGSGARSVASASSVGGSSAGLAPAARALHRHKRAQTQKQQVTKQACRDHLGYAGTPPTKRHIACTHPHNTDKEWQASV